MDAATSYIGFYLGTSNENSHHTLTLLVDKLAFALPRFFPELDHLDRDVQGGLDRTRWERASLA